MGGFSTPAGRWIIGFIIIIIIIIIVVIIITSRNPIAPHETAAETPPATATCSQAVGATPARPRSRAVRTRTRVPGFCKLELQATLCLRAVRGHVLLPPAPPPSSPSNPSHRDSPPVPYACAANERSSAQPRIQALHHPTERCDFRSSPSAPFQLPPAGTPEARNIPFHLHQQKSARAALPTSVAVLSRCCCCCVGPDHHFHAPLTHKPQSLLS